MMSLVEEECIFIRFLTGFRASLLGGVLQTVERLKSVADALLESVKQKHQGLALIQDLSGQGQTDRLHCSNLEVKKRELKLTVNIEIDTAYLGEVELEAAEPERPVVLVGLIFPLGKHSRVVKLERLSKWDLGLKEKSSFQTK